MLAETARKADLQSFQPAGAPAEFPVRGARAALAGAGRAQCPVAPGGLAGCGGRRVLAGDFRSRLALARAGHGLVWLAEAFNTAVEGLCDRIHPEFDPAIGRIKDLGAGGVLVASIAAALIGVLTLGPPLLARLF